MSSGADRFTRAQMERQVDVPELPTATVTSIGPPVTVDYLGASLQLPHMEHYTPSVGHVVVLVRVGGIWTILGRPVGHPTA